MLEYLKFSAVHKLSMDHCTSCHLIIMATVRVMRAADTPTADAKAMTLRRPAGGKDKRGYLPDWKQAVKGGNGGWMRDNRR